MLKEISTVDEYNQLLSEGVIPIDVRSSTEIAEGKIPEAATSYDWNNGEFHDNFDQLDPEKSYLLSAEVAIEVCKPVYFYNPKVLTMYITSRAV